MKFSLFVTPHFLYSIVLLHILCQRFVIIVSYFTFNESIPWLVGKTFLFFIFQVPTISSGLSSGPKVWMLSYCTVVPSIYSKWHNYGSTWNFRFVKEFIRNYFRIVRWIHACFEQIAFNTNMLRLSLILVPRFGSGLKSGDIRGQKSLGFPVNNLLTLSFSLVFICW